MPAKIYIVRHGETDSNANGIIHGQVDIPLNETGKVQAQRLAEALAGEPIEAIFSSDLSRAAETARAVANKKGVEVVTTDLFRERHQGPFEGEYWEVVAAKYPDFAERVYWSDTNDLGVESSIEVRKRVWRGIELIRESYSMKTVAIFSHGGTVRQMVQMLTASDLDGLEIGNTSVSILEKVSNERYNVIKVGDMSHLESGE